MHADSPGKSTCNLGCHTAKARRVPRPVGSASWANFWEGPPTGSLGASAPLLTGHQLMPWKDTQGSFAKWQPMVIFDISHP
jgi:hypothetical protein